MSDRGSCSGLSDETGPGRFIVEISRVNDFECHWAMKIDIESLVRDPHRAAAKLKRPAIVALQNLEVSKAKLLGARI
jgi:hypothetical protein